MHNYLGEKVFELSQQNSQIIFTTYMLKLNYFSNFYEQIQMNPLLGQIPVTTS